MGKHSGAAAASKISSSSLAAQTQTSSTPSKSSILKSSFAPTYLQLRLFASVIQSFESQQLRIHDFSNGRLRQQYSIPAGNDVTCLEWGCYGQAYRESRQPQNKKRKRIHDPAQHAVVAYGTSSSEICMYSPSEGTLVGILKAGHKRGVRDFRFNPENNLQAWSIAGDGQLLQWDLQKDQVVRSISLPDPKIQRLSTPSVATPAFFCASVIPYAVDVDATGADRFGSFDAFKHPVHTLIRSEEGPDAGKHLLAADNDRYMNIYDITERKIVRTVVAGSGVEVVAIHHPKGRENQMLAVVTREGAVEVFSKPFDVPQPQNGSIAIKKKSTVQKASATVNLVASASSKTQIPAFHVTFDGPNLIIASVTSGIEPIFQKLRWEDEGNGELLFSGKQEIIRPTPASTLNTATINGIKNTNDVHVNDARTVIVNGLAEPGSQAAPMEIVDSEDDEVESDAQSQRGIEDDGDDDDSTAPSDTEMLDANQYMDDTKGGEGEEGGEPSFGELLAARHPEEISILDTLPSDKNALSKTAEFTQKMLPSGMSLGTVLTQSLRTNDQSLLETCLHVTDENVIQNTILRLESSLAANLLTKLAELLADRPGRYGHLLTWVQSTMIAHGGAIASQAGVSSKLRALYQVLSERSKILPNILLLKGKLDMMSAQQSFRAQANEYRKGTSDVPTTIYIEGQPDNWSSDEDVDEEAPSAKKKRRRSKPRKDLDALIGEAESSDDETMPLVNGHGSPDEEDEEDSDSEHEAPAIRPRLNGIVDIEADVSGEESDDVEGSGVEGTDEDEDDDDDEDDSSMDSFINDGEVSIDEDVDAELEEVDAKPLKKKSKNR